MIDVRCPKCNKLLCKVNGMGTVIEMVCPRCGVRVQWPSLTAVVVPSLRRVVLRRPPGPKHIKGKDDD